MYLRIEAAETGEVFTLRREDRYRFDMNQPVDDVNRFIFLQY